MSYLNSKVTITIDVTDDEPFDGKGDTPAMIDKINAGVTADLESLIRGYYTAYGQYDVTVNAIDVHASHVEVEKAAA